MDPRFEGRGLFLAGLALLLFFTSFTGVIEAAQSLEDGFIERLLAGRPERFGDVLERAGEYRLQILLSEVVPDRAGGAGLRRHGYRVDAEYFYPASAIKLVGAISAVKVVESQSRVSLETPMRFSPVFEGEVIEEEDPSNLEGGTIAVGHEIRKLFLVSDNEAFNRLYELTGHREINEFMHRAGLPSVRVLHRLSEFRSPEEQRRTPQIDFLLGGQETLIVQARDSKRLWRNQGLAGLDVGSAYMSGGERIADPLSFRDKNRISLVDLQDLLILLLRPDIGLGKPGFALTDVHREFLRQAMSEYPAESRNPTYDRSEFPDEHVKFLLPGLLRVVPGTEVSIFNKVGRAYGFSIENAYVVHETSARSFFLTAALYTNPNGVLNDDDYAYEDVADPFLADLGETIARKLWDR